MTIGDFRKRTNDLADDFEIEITADVVSDRPFNFYDLENISIDIGYSCKVVHIFGDLYLGQVEEC